ncbi:MAG: hypothetical protein QM817_06225 [Archangium sp.]
MLSLVTLALLSADPVVVVGRFEIVNQDASLAPLSRALQSVLEFDLRENGVAVRTDDDLDSSQWGKIKGATHLFVATVVKVGSSMSINARVIKQPNIVDGVVRAKSLVELDPLVLLVLQKTGTPTPPTLKMLKVNEELLLAWGAALDAVHDGSPEIAKAKVAEVAKKWPTFTPAVERLKQL